MNRRILFIPWLLMLILLPQAMAASSANLRWAVDVGDEAEYDVQVFLRHHETHEYWEYGREEVYIYLANIEALPVSIDVPPTGVIEWKLYLIDYRFFWANGSSIEVGTPLYFPASMYEHFMPAVPVGDWSLLSDLVDNVTIYNIDYSLFENDTIWGYTAIYENVTWNSGFYKSDGSLASYYHNWTIDTLSWVWNFKRLNPPENGASPIDSTLLLIGVAGGAVVIVVLVVLFKKR